MVDYYDEILDVAIFEGCTLQVDKPAPWNALLLQESFPQNYRVMIQM